MDQNGKWYRNDYSNYVPGYRFAVSLGNNDNYDKVCFSKISGIESTLDYEEIQEGGYNASAHLLPAPHKKHAALVLERGAAPYDSWINKLKPGMRLGTWLEVVLLDAAGNNTERRFLIQDGIVTKWEIAGLDVLGNNILVEKLEIMHEGIRYSK